MSSLRLPGDERPRPVGQALRRFRPTLLEAPWLLAVLATGTVVGHAAGATGNVGLAGSAAALASVLVLAISSPAFGLWVAVAVPAIELMVPVTAWRLAGIVVLAAVITASYGTAHVRARRISVCWLALTAWIMMDALLFCPHSSVTGQLLLGTLYCGLVGMAATLTSISMTHVRSVLVGWGLAASWVAVTTQGLIQNRTEVLLGENANGIGLLAALGTVAALASLRTGRLGFLWAIPSAVCVAGIAASGSRGALLAAVGGVLVAFLVPLLRTSRVRAALVALAALATMVLVVQPLVDWFTTFTGRGAASFENIGSREEALALAIQTGLTHPLTGIGIGQLADFSLSASDDRLGLRAHNEFAGMFAETGLFGLVLLGAIFLLAVKQALRSHRARDLMVVTALLFASVALEWWATPRLGVLAVLILATASGSPSTSLSHEPGRTGRDVRRASAFAKTSKQ